jgi:RNA polymerase sigma factor (sigma-70 family)
MKKNGKIKSKLLSLDKNKLQELNHEIEYLIKNDLSFIINKLINSYYYTLKETFGYEREDIMQLIRIRLWRGLATFDSSKNVKKTTYLYSVLNNYFLTLSTMSKALKNKNSKFTFLDDEEDKNDDVFDKQNFQTYEQSEFNEIDENFFYRIQNRLSLFERNVFILYFLMQNNHCEIAQRLGTGVKKISQTIKELKTKINEFKIELEHEEGELDNEFKLEPESEPEI